MSKNYSFFADLNKEIGEIPSNGIISKTIINNSQLKAILFGFDRGQELSEHTASLPAIINIIKGEAKITLGDDKFESQAGSLIYLNPKLPHRIYARTPLTMLLLLLKSVENKD